jgi:hypothetical protein
MCHLMIGTERFHETLRFRSELTRLTAREEFIAIFNILRRIPDTQGLPCLFIFWKFLLLAGVYNASYHQALTIATFCLYILIIYECHIRMYT